MSPPGSGHGLSTSTPCAYWGSARGCSSVGIAGDPGPWEVGVLHEDNRSTRRGLAPFVMICAAGVLAAACQSSSSSGAGGTPAKHSHSPDTVQLSFTPASGATGADPGKGITVTASKGTIKAVTVTGDGLTGERSVTGTLNSSRTAWHSNWTLPVAETLTVTAVATDSRGHQV